MSSRTLYQRILGQEFSKLPAILQKFHSRPEGGCADGVVTVEHGSGRFHHVAAGLLGLPNPGEMPLRLQVIPEDGREIWIRQFGRQTLRSLQWRDGPYLIEKAGPFHFAFRLTADEYSLTFHPSGGKLRGISISDRISPRVSAQAQGAGNCWQIAVTIAAPLLGTITTYRGRVTPRDDGSIRDGSHGRRNLSNLANEPSVRRNDF